MLFTKAEWEMLVTLAKIADITPSAYVRALVRGSYTRAQRKGAITEPKPKKQPVVRVESKVQDASHILEARERLRR